MRQKQAITMAFFTLLLLLTAACGEPPIPGPKSYPPRKAESRKQIYDRQKIFTQLDKNKDGFLSSKEYNGTMKLFQDLDKDKDNKISPKEARYMMTFADIPTGRFTMGSNEPIRAFFEPSKDMIPAHTVKIDAFKMSATEVTTTQYVLFLNSALKAGKIKVKLGDIADDMVRIHYPVPTYMVKGAPGTKYAGKPYTYLSPITGLSHIKAQNSPLLIPEHPFNASWIQYNPESKTFSVYPGFEDWPVAFIKWWGAMAFAEYYGLSLPTEAEWEYVARGGKQHKFATGNGKNGCNNANYKCYNVMNLKSFEGADTPDEYIGFRMKVGSYSANAYGVYDLAGNLWEWTLDWYRKDFYKYCVDNGITSNPLQLKGEDPPMDRSAKGGPGQTFSHDARICRGGSYNYHEVVTRSAYRFPVYPYIGNDHFGARVVIRPSTVVFNGKQ